MCVCVCVCVSESECAQSCPILCDPTDSSPPGSSVHRISQERILEWVAISSSRGSSRPRDWTFVFFHLLHWQADSLPLRRLGSSLISYVLLQINEMDTLPLWNNTASLIFQSCSGRDSGPLPQSWQGQSPSKSHLKTAASPRSRRDHPADLEQRPVEFPGLACPPLHTAHRSWAEISPRLLPSGSSYPAPVWSRDVEAWFPHRFPEQEAENVRVSHLLWAKVWLNIPWFIIVKSQGAVGVYLAPSLLSATKESCLWLPRVKGNDSHRTLTGEGG